MPFADPPKLAFALDANGKPKFSGWRRCYTLLADFPYVDPQGFIKPIVVKAGFQSDLASLPLRPIVLGAVLLSIVANVLATKYLNDFGEMWADGAVVVLVALVVGYLRHDGPWASAAIIHDAIYRNRLADRDVGDLVMRKVMRETGVPSIVAWTFWFCLRLFGWAAWRKRSLLAISISLLLTSAAQAETVVVTITGDNCPYCREHARAMTDAGVRAELRTAKALTISLHESTLAQSQVDGQREVPIGVNGRVVKVEPFAVRGWPIVMVVDAQGDQGKILRRFDGAMPVGELRAFIRGGGK
jgi:hypothetical protein